MGVTGDSYIRTLYTEHLLDEMPHFMRVQVAGGDTQTVKVGVDLLALLMPYLLGGGQLEGIIDTAVSRLMGDCRIVVEKLKKGREAFEEVDLLFVADGRVPALKAVACYVDR